MKNIIIGIFATSMLFASCDKGEKSTPETSFTGLKTTQDSLSYFLGMYDGKNMKTAGLDEYFSEEVYMKGLKAVFNEDSLILDERLGGAIANRIAMANQQKQIEAQKSQFQVKITAGETFLNQKSQEEGVKTLPSGLRYKVIKQGNGAIPTAMDKVKTHYHGTLIDGSVFESSFQNGTPVEFQVGGVIKGWTEALQLMPVGSTYEIYLPYDLAYGATGSRDIQPYETLIFRLELIDITTPK